MRKIHQLFHQSCRDLIKKVTLGENRTKLCWYPSASDDFRHVYFLEKEGLEKPNNPPLVYICTDMHIPNFLDNKDFYPERKIISGIKIQDISEIYLKKPIIDISGGVWSGSPDNNLSKAFLVLMDIDFFVNNRHVIVSIPLIYLMLENLIFLTDIILSHQMNIHTLIHIKDGGGTMGGSQIPMDFIYKADKLIKLKRVIADMSVSDKFNDLCTDFDFFEVLEGQCKHIQHKNIFIKRLLNSEQLKFSSKEGIKSRWSSKEVELPQVQKNPHHDTQLEKIRRGYDVDKSRYYDWRNQ